MFILKSAPGSLLSSADTLYLVRNSSEWAHEATAPADSWTQATTDNITTKHFMVTRNTFAKFQRTLFFCFCVHSRSRVRECGRRARRVCPHRSAFPDWRGPRRRGPSRPVRPSPSAGALKFYLGTEIKWKDIELFKTCILKRIEFYGLLNRWRHRQWTWNLSIALHQDINFSFRWIEYYNHCSIIFCGYKSKQKVDVGIVWGW